MKMKLLVLAAACACIGTVLPIAAHHGFDTEYDAKKKVSLNGVVTKVEWTNPHMHVYIDVADASGKVTNWNLEMASPNTVIRQGWEGPGRRKGRCYPRGARGRKHGSSPAGVKKRPRRGERGTAI